MATQMSGSNLIPPRQDATAQGSSWTSVAAVPSSFSPAGEANAAASNPEHKSTAEQLKILHKDLETAKRIQAGAENMLHLEEMHENELLRQQVETELMSARTRIDNIEKKIDQLATQTSRKQGDPSVHAGRRRPTPQVRGFTKDEGDDRDDFRTSLHHANTCVKTLASITRGTTSPMASTTPSSSSGQMPPTPQDVQSDRTRIETMNRLAGILQRNLRVRYEMNSAEVLKNVIPALSDRNSKECRASAYRLVRHTLVDVDSVERLREYSLDWYIVKSLARDNKHAVEKEQVIKLIRAIVEIGSQRAPNTAVGTGMVPLSEAVTRALIAVAEHSEDPFKNICVQTLLEILLIDTELMARTGGMRVLLHTMADGPLDMAPLIASAFLYIVDSPRTREYLNPGTELEIVLSGVTDAYGKGEDHAERMRASTRLISMMLRTWSGLLYLCLEDLAAIRSVIDTLRIPSLETREIVLDMFFDLLNIKPPEWYKTFIDGRRLTMYRRSGGPNVQEQRKTADSTAQRIDKPMKLTDQYIALMLLIFTKAGLLEALISMLEESTTGSNLSRKATLLMAEVMQMASRLLPLVTAADVQAIPRVFDLASDYKLGEHRIVGTSALSAIDSFNRNRARLQPTTVAAARPRANSVEDAVRRGQRQVEQVKIKMGMQMDDKTFQATLLETNVMMTKDHTKWNFEVLSDVIEGPLLNSKRMEEAIKVSKFMRRLMSFFHPFNRRFSDMPAKGNGKWAKLGNSLLTTLLATPEGQRFIGYDDPFIREIVKGFAELDPYNPTPPTDPIFSIKRMEETLTHSYIDMLGTLSRTKEGTEILEKFHVFTAYYHLMELKSRADLMIRIIETLDYSIDGHPRVVLSKALTSNYKHVRLHATCHLGELIRRSTTPTAWTLRLLLTQLYDPALPVCEAAVHFLEEACEDPAVLQLVVEMRPTWEHLGPVGHPLVLKAMSTPLGFRYLHDSGYIHREMDAWIHDRNVAYVVQVEVFLSKAFNFTLSAQGEAPPSFESSVPPHFYGEMAKTELGCAVLHDKGHFGDFTSFIRQHSRETEDVDVILQLKSMLWAVGNVGAAEGGLPFLEEEEIIPVILEIAEESPVLSVRGTCFFVLGLISSTMLGAELLCDYGWEATLSPLGLPTGICIPKELDKFIAIPTWTPPPPKMERSLNAPTKDIEVEVLTAIYNLSNTVIANNASRSLAKMKSRSEYREVFTSPMMLYRALNTISTQKYRLPVRRYIMELFDLPIDSETVRAIGDAAKKLRVASPGQKAIRPANQRVLSVVGRPVGKPAKARTTTGEKEGEEPEEDVRSKAKRVARRQVMSLRPVSKIIGFQ